MQFVITAFYHFADLPDFHNIRAPLLKLCTKHGLKGTVLLAKEGINSTISGTREAVNVLYEALSYDPRLKGFAYKESFADFQPFEKLKVKLKKEIVTMGISDLNMSKRGEYIDPKYWDEFISRDDVVLIDTRNEYECALGYFDKAIDPRTHNFREFPEWVKQNQQAFQGKKIAMYCTGGIRCEKSTALMRNLGFDEVYHLRGGILQYFEDTGNKQGKWHGECFVFDDRVTVDNNLNIGNKV